MQECLLFLFDQKKAAPAETPAAVCRYAVLQEACNDQITSHIPTGIFHTLFLKMPETKMQQTVTDDIFPLSNGCFPVRIQINVPIVCAIRPVCFCHGITFRAVYTRAVCKPEQGAILNFFNRLSPCGDAVLLRFFLFSAHIVTPSSFWSVQAGHGSLPR